jgi:hypothetical protein
MDMAMLIVSMLFFAVLSYGNYVLWDRVIMPAVKSGDPKTSLTALALVFTMLVVVLGGGRSYAQSDTISFDLDAFFESLNTYIPVFMAIFGVVGGIAAAISLVRFIINSVINAFNGGRI